METTYLEAKHPEIRYGDQPHYEKIIWDKEGIKHSSFWFENSWIEETSFLSAEQQIERLDTLHSILEADKPIRIVGGWIYRVVSPLEALVLFGKEK